MLRLSEEFEFIHKHYMLLRLSRFIHRLLCPQSSPSRKKSPSEISLARHLFSLSGFHPSSRQRSRCQRSTGTPTLNQFFRRSQTHRYKCVLLEEDAGGVFLYSTTVQLSGHSVLSLLPTCSIIFLFL